MTSGHWWFAFLGLGCLFVLAWSAYQFVGHPDRFDADLARSYQRGEIDWRELDDGNARVYASAVHSEARDAAVVSSQVASALLGTFLFGWSASIPYLVAASLLIGTGVLVQMRR